jgi:hypothetical protein
MSPRRSAASYFLGWVWVGVFAGGAGCTRASVASALPTLDVALVGSGRRSAASGADEHAERRWSAALFVGLSFRPVVAAAQLPLRAELAPETWILPCDDDDVICLQEAIGAESELSTALGELQ